MIFDRNRLSIKLSILTTLLGFSFLLCSLALATPADQLESDEGNWVYINDESVIDAPLSIVVDHFKDVKKVNSMIPGLKIKKILKQISDSERIDYDHYELPWPFKDRYMIYRAREKNIAGRKILLTMNPLGNHPFEDKSKVAIRIKESSFLLQSLPEDETKTRVIVKLTLDPGGFLPVWLINLNAKNWSKDLFQNLRKNIRREIAKQKISRINIARNANTGPSSTF